jgi:hypothetical protein
MIRLETIIIHYIFSEVENKYNQLISFICLHGTIIS